MPYVVSDYIHEPLFVLCPIYNPIRYKARWRLYERFAKHVKDSGGVLVTIEASFRDRHHALDEGETQHETPIHQTAPEKPTEFHRSRTDHPHMYIKVRCDSEFFLKENLLQLAMNRLPPEARYIAWVDGDVAFTRPNWVGETVHQLQHWDWVQMWSDAVDVGPLYMPIATHKSFMWCLHHNLPLPSGSLAWDQYYQPAPARQPGAPNLWHPGYAWAARREALDAVGGLIQFAVLGAGDNHMARALVGKVEESFHPNVHPRYQELLREWQTRALRHIDHRVGYVSGLLIHYWHGAKVRRNYWQRWRILVEQQFNPDTDIQQNTQGVLELVDAGDERRRILRQRLMRYLRARHEDSIALQGVEQNEWTL
jgi:hypothetical protein